MEIKQIKIVKNFGLLVLKLTLKDQNWSLVCKYVTSKQNSFQESSKQKLWIKKLYKTRKIKSTDRPFTQVIVWELKYPCGYFILKASHRPRYIQRSKKTFSHWTLFDNTCSQTINVAFAISSKKLSIFFCAWNWTQVIFFDLSSVLNLISSSYIVPVR